MPVQNLSFNNEKLFSTEHLVSAPGDENAPFEAEGDLECNVEQPPDDLKIKHLKRLETMKESRA